MLHFVTPIFVVGALLVVWAIQQGEAILLARCGKSIPVFLRYYTWMWILFSCLLFGTVPSIQSIMEQSGWLDDAVVDEFVRARMIAEGDTDALKTWQEEAYLGGYPALKWFSLLSMFFVLCTFGVCVGHTIFHVREIQRCIAHQQLESVALHDHVIRILALPFVYGLMSFQGVVRMWGVSINYIGEHGHFKTWENRKAYLEDMYDEARMLGDVYETVALLTFGALALRVLDHRVNRRMKRALLHSNSLDSVENLEDMAISHEDTTIATNSSVMKKLSSSVKKLMAEMRDITMYGVMLFAATCILQAVYQFFITTFAYYEWWECLFRKYDKVGLEKAGLLQSTTVQNKVNYFFLGAGFVSSFAAIGNLVHIERGFHSAELEEFGPFLKFWGTKVLVSLAYLQDMAQYVPPFSGWSEPYFQLFYASLVTLECLGISILHVWAWSPYEKWYSTSVQSDSSETESGTTSEAKESDVDS